MLQYDVYGVGNALVDTEFEVEDSYLQEMSVDKGLMTLVDQNRQSELLNHLTGIQHKMSCGGSAANTMIAVAQLGGTSFYSCKVANDDAGDFYSKDLKNEGVTSNIQEGRTDGVTGRCFVFITPDAERTMNTYLGITETFSQDELREAEIPKSKYLYMEGYLVTSPTGRAAAIQARKVAEANQVKTSITFSDPGIVAHFKDGLREMIGDGVDIIFCNEAEALSFTDCSDISAAAQQLKSHCRQFAITRGAEGALVYDGENEITVPTPQIKPVDTNGAGDIFAGSFLYALSRGHDFEKAGRLSCAAASKLVTQFGARLHRDQMQEVLKTVL